MIIMCNFFLEIFFIGLGELNVRDNLDVGMKC